MLLCRTGNGTRDLAHIANANPSNVSVYRFEVVLAPPGGFFRIRPIDLF
ncbi:hypothetical protein QWZ08_13960 [Ferruginibacter paludis]|nr:hypothetical protein [Ferruginibacter paludis]MDN3656746.1 hypothetical protein [Ferruginibacter paludis]